MLSAVALAAVALQATGAPTAQGNSADEPLALAVPTDESAARAANPAEPVTLTSIAEQHPAPTGATDEPVGPARAEDRSSASAGTAVDSAFATSSNESIALARAMVHSAAFATRSNESIALARATDESVALAGTLDRVGDTGTTEFVPAHGTHHIWSAAEFASSATSPGAVNTSFEPESTASPVTADASPAEFPSGAAWSETMERGLASAATAPFVPVDSNAAEFHLGAADLGPRIESFGDWPSVDRSAQLASSTCSITPSASFTPAPGIADIGDPSEVECAPLGIDTLRYSVPGPTHGIDPGPPIYI